MTTQAELKEAKRIADQFFREMRERERLFRKLFRAIRAEGMPTGVTLKGWQRHPTRKSLIIHYAGKRKSFGHWDDSDVPLYLSQRLRDWKRSIWFSNRPSRFQMDAALDRAERMIAARKSNQAA